MRKHKLHLDALKIESFNTIADPMDVRGTVQDKPNGCICFAPPCVCSAGPDCTQRGTQ